MNKVISARQRPARAKGERPFARASTQVELPSPTSTGRVHDAAAFIVVPVSLVAVATFSGRAMHSVFDLVGTNGYLVFAGLALVASAMIWGLDRPGRPVSTLLVVRKAKEGESLVLSDWASE
jgi:hypothetical protein